MACGGSTDAAPDAMAALLDERWCPRAGSKLYRDRAYWDYRFAREDRYEWLASYDVFKHVVHDCVPARDARILVVGNGNSALPVELHADGYCSTIGSDYSTVVIDRMRAAQPQVEWRVADMTALPFEADSFDVVIDKAAMDALLAGGGDCWDPPVEHLTMSERVCGEVARVLKRGGVYLQLSFAQPHFRRKHLEQTPGRWQRVDKHDIESGLGYFCYACFKA